jgi:protease I
MVKKILIPLPLFDFDPTEAAVPWKILKNNGMEVVFSTSNGTQATPDMKILTGKSLGVFAPVLAADKNGKEAYSLMSVSDEFKCPVKWSDLKASDFDGLILPGGHDKGMREYLESNLLKSLIVEFFKENKPVGAICHGVVLAARSTLNGKSVIAHKKTTSLLKSQELLAWLMTRLWLGSYYRTYEETVESEVKRSLFVRDNFLSGPLPFKRDCLDNLESGFVVVDGNYLSARWPGDAHRFGVEYLKLLTT